MAEKMTRDEWRSALDDIAVSAGQEWLKDMHKRGWKEANELGQKGVYEAVLERLMKEYPYETTENEAIQEAIDIPSLDWARWINKTGPDPRVTAQQRDMQKYLPLLKGIAEPGKDWLSMGGSALQYLSTEPDFGYKMNKEDYSKFLNKLSKYQTVYDRGLLAKELRDNWWYFPTKLVYPSMMEGAEGAIATGEGGDPAQILGLGALDAGTNLAIFGAPSMKFMPTAPIRNAAINAGAQGAAETLRQGGKVLIDPNQEMSWSAPVLAASLGLSRPGLVGTTQAAVARIPGKEAKEISRGISKATRAGNPVTNEEENLRMMVKQFNTDRGLLNKYENTAKENLDYLYSQLENKSPDLSVKLTKPNKAKLYSWMVFDKSVADTEKMLGMQKVKDMASVLGVKPNKEGLYDVEEFMKAYGRRPVYTWRNTPEGGIKITTPLKGESTPDLLQLGPETADKYKALFPAKYADEAEATKLRSLGLGIGKVLGDLGGRVEPMIKVNPFAAGPKPAPEYNETDWYLKLHPKARQIIDEAFKYRAKPLEEDDEDF